MFTKLLVMLLFVVSQSEASSQNAGERGSQFDAFAFGIVIGILLSMLWQNDFDVNAIIEKITRKDDSAAKKQPDSSRKRDDEEAKTIIPKSIRGEHEPRTAKALSVYKNEEPAKTPQPSSSRTQSNVMIGSGVDADRKLESPKLAVSTRPRQVSIRSEPLHGPLPERHKKILEGKAPKQMVNEWIEIYALDPFPQCKLVQALFRPLDTLEVQFVALRYQQGEAAMGRVWKNKDDKIEACFSWSKYCLLNPDGPILVLCELPTELVGFTYSWQSFPVAVSFEKNKEWHPVRVDNLRKDISPAVILLNGKEILGKVDLRGERATVGYAGQVHVFVGPSVHHVKVLCRKATPGHTFD